MNIYCKKKVLRLDETVVLVLEKGREINEILFPEALHHINLSMFLIKYFFIKHLILLTKYS